MGIAMTVYLSVYTNLSDSQLTCYTESTAASLTLLSSQDVGV